MAIDLSVSNSIINSFAQGKQEALQREKLKKDAEQQEIENDARAKAAAEQTRQFNEKFKQDADALKASQSLQTAQFNLSKALALPQFQKLAEESGAVPGFSATPGQPAFPGQDPTSNTFTGNLPGLEGITFNAATPTEAARREAERQRIIQKPKNDAEMAELEKKLQGDLEREELKANLESVEKQADRASREKIAELNRRSRVEAARLSGVNNANITKASQFSNQYNANPIVKRYAIMKEANDYVQNIKSGGAISDYALLVAYVKATDPESVAREGEVKAAQSAAQTLSDQFKFKLNRINRLVPFLSDEARKQIQSEVQDKFTATEKSYLNFKTGTEKKFKEIGMNPAGWLVDYEGEKPMLDEDKPATGGKVDTTGWTIKEKK